MRNIFTAKGVMLAFILTVAAITTGCITTNVDCGGGTDGRSGPDGASGCYTKSAVGQTVDGQTCQSGNVCRFKGTFCDVSNPSAKCTDTITNGVCACKCQ